MNITVTTKPAKSLEDFHHEKILRVHLPYFHRLRNGYLNLRVITRETNLKWLEDEISHGNIWIPKEKLTAESN
ncbi:hypothetical protein PBT90_00035 [Algoriphagus halophytocola]|uniref:hypothetical protein n=1 Tax=Algoriphagus halophytocola TaxID=2991499 RepID=UPI0022DDB97E|nr:hypothetical protein [Algoriphagus sp. TR-M9]WBL42367.1 hypothetical protein PBT90_16650 [Algoriphagus sp. TR-M9]WBL43096.1 hypothetical protein PBT90_00035 [Algoriphagus sp. TR-M9]